MQMDNKTIFEAFEKATYTAGALNYDIFQPQHRVMVSKMKAKNKRQRDVFRARLEKILGIE